MHIRRQTMAYKTREWRNNMRVTVDFNYMMAKNLG